MSTLSPNGAHRSIVINDDSGNGAPRSIEVAVVDDHQLLAETLVELLNTLGAKARRAVGETAEEILEDLLRPSPDVAIVDYHLGDEVGDATQLIGPLVHSGIKVMVVTGDMTRITAAECYEAGALAVLTKGMPADDLVVALGRVAKGERLIGDDERHALLRELRDDRSRRRHRLGRFDDLTPRETEVLSMICEGLSAAEISEASFVSMATVRSQIRSILMKLDVKSQLAAAAEAYRSGWVDSQATQSQSSRLAMTQPT